MTTIESVNADDATAIKRVSLLLTTISLVLVLFSAWSTLAVKRSTESIERITTVLPVTLEYHRQYFQNFVPVFLSAVLTVGIVLLVGKKRKLYALSAVLLLQVVILAFQQFALALSNMYLSEVTRRH